VILADTSVWIEHLRRGLPQLVALLESDEVLMHPVVIGELACGNLRNRPAFLSLLADLPTAREANHEEVLVLLEQRQLFGRRIGYLDAHLLASAALSAPARLWTLDQRLSKAAASMGVA
jgi:predicted nucleic acid-binding protein